MEEHDWSRKVANYNKKSPDHYPEDFWPCLMFLVAHATISLTQIAFSYLIYNSLWLHTFFALYIFCTAIYNGAVKYFKMMTTYYVK